MATSMSTSMSVVRCPMCTFYCSTPNEWLNHLQTTNHEHQQFNVRCCFDNCSHPKSFSTFSGLKSHVYRMHYQDSHSSEGESSSDEQTIHQVENDYTIVSDDICHNTMTKEDISRLLHTDQEQQKKDAALFIMRLREVRHLFQTAIDDVISGSRSLFNSTHLRLQAGIRQRLAEKGCADVEVDDMLEEFQDPFLP